jgi:hypothetical protein
MSPGEAVAELLPSPCSGSIALLSCRTRRRLYEIFHYRFPHQVRGEEALREDKIMELFLVELGSHGRLCVFA